MASTSIKLCGLFAILSNILTPACAATDSGWISSVDNSNQQLPVQADFDPNTKSMQQLCAKTDYGGGSAGQHIGSYCARAPLDIWTDVTGEVAFDQYETNQQLANQRLFSECLSRCWCANASTGASTGPAYAPRNLVQQPKYIAPNPAPGNIYYRFPKRCPPRPTRLP